MDLESNQALAEEWKTEAGLLLSSQLLLEYNAFYFYTACAAHFGNPTVCLRGLERFFKECSLEENEHAQKIIDFMNMRGLKIEFQSVEAPDIKKYEKTSDILEASKEFEQAVLKNILTISEIAAKAGDGTIVEFLEDFVAEQVRSISKLNDLHVNCVRCGDSGMGLFVFDQSLLKEH
ncbi:ferritin [Encephalitozoon hellem ATCC 50504]|uniref:Ferritin n=1 Tax=Encephalitozoon hellem TaxID=27973 RepID=A0A9Q9C8H8_ENCHE|nr:ferritin [Encephalitozoon hellem ATCC 50504]AFM98505.1 ferritin [Encephalitozoon hellem ATCC 50504]UTX43430.1 ferritin heavy chain [Encephalitozoon hellem]WEL38895.1 ferritin [Encephalitozoon hellem]|eukprot:XP_003887486.1 ferritin [Encephalitozoon hellem ATCC 50504]